MKYSKFYLDQFFNSINEYQSKVELLILANSFMQKTENIRWVMALNQLMNWQSMSERSGVWTYYEVLEIDSANVLIRILREYDDRIILENYCKGIDNYLNEEIMNEVDNWIGCNETEIDRFIEHIFLMHRDWFYNYSAVTP
ncbi:hypothetical protein PAALTS15_00460 [Paenibacillus alvei TS-15]|uniref:Uncharacterized protein n=1 Tax=Paenibacillus alvei TS-15 TaxID=1117108 RepID=S9SXE0_PAEAL|nr:hypothetical protein [Paenibacillus alvei]EPY09319.1 hypothetical protein PAALTS15_00460 [Paenibacillus alvei TS-15]